MPSRTRPPALALVPAMVMAFCAGCTGGHSVTLRNSGTESIYAAIQERTEAGERVITSKRAGVGETVTLGPVESRVGGTYLWLDTRPNPGVPLLERLHKGNNAIEVLADDNGRPGHLRVGPDTRQTEPGA